MNQALCKLFLSLFSQEIQQTFEEELTANPNMNFNDTCQSFCNAYGRVTKDEAKDNKGMLTRTAAWQPYQGVEALKAQIKTCLVYDHFAKKVIPDKDLTNALFVVIKQIGCYQVGYDRWEFIPSDERTNWINTNLWWKKKYLCVKSLM